MNNKYYSCERNHYFFGKLMTVRDFENEQTYFNSKRHLGNRMLNGAGIVSGLDVILVDSRTFSLESGMAIDYSGREIVVPEPSIKRLNVIRGFEENRESSDLYLCLEYKENLKESTFSVAGSSKDSGVSQEYNRVSEGYDLFLTSEKPNIKNLGLNHLITDRVTLFDKNGVKLELQISKYVNPSNFLKVSVIFEKNNISAPVKYKFNVSGEFFESVVDNEKELKIEYQETEVTTYKRIKKDYFLSCNAISDTVTDFVIKKDTFSLEIGQDYLSIDDDLKQSVTITTRPLRDIVIENYYSTHFTEITDEKEDQYIYLAKFHIVSNQSTYFIGEIEKHPFNQYVLSNELLDILQSLPESGSMNINPNHFSNMAVNATNQTNTPVNLPDSMPSDAKNVATGVERINLGFYPKVGKSYYSYEFVHGLGYGRVGVITAVENKSNYLTNDDNIIIFGDSGIFNSEKFALSSPAVKIGAIVNPDKGTMKLGIKLEEKTNLQYIDVAWWAYKVEGNENKGDDVLVEDDISVVITPNTTRVEPMGQVRFTAKVEGSTNQEVRWIVVDEGAGKIDNNGLYTAPAKEGVYEIRAESTQFEGKSDSAYVVVSNQEE